jgi:hypothetical protein
MLKEAVITDTNQNKNKKQKTWIPNLNAAASLPLL